jgi:hypothetical protein
LNERTDVHALGGFPCISVAPLCGVAKEWRVPHLGGGTKKSYSSRPFDNGIDHEKCHPFEFKLKLVLTFQQKDFKLLHRCCVGCRYFLICEVLPLEEAKLN